MPLLKLSARLARTSQHRFTRARRPPPLPAARQVYYPVAPEVHRDLLWEDVDVADPAEYTFCRYTPITTEASRRFCCGFLVARRAASQAQGAAYAACQHPPAGPARTSWP